MNDHHAQWNEPQLTLPAPRIDEHQQQKLQDLLVAGTAFIDAHSAAINEVHGLARQRH